MKAFTTIAAILSYVSAVFAGALVPRVDQSPNTVLATTLPIGCYNTGDAPNLATACAFKIDYCDGDLNGNNCARFCHCNDHYEIVCDNSKMEGCSKAQMAEGCASTTHHWWCTCNPFNKEKRQEVDAGKKSASPAVPVIPAWEAPTRVPATKLKERAAMYVTCS